MRWENCWKSRAKNLERSKARWDGEREEESGKRKKEAISRAACCQQEKAREKEGFDGATN
jgi:hypothetical protein